MASTQLDGSASQAPPDGHDILSRIQILAAIGCALIVVYALRFWCTGDVLRILGVGVLVGAAALAAGGLSGFVFGIPREGSPSKNGDTGAAHPSPSDKHANPITSNSNLSEISDWLTKIVVGLGLVELKSIPSALGSLSYYVGRGLQPAQCSAGSSSDWIFGGQSLGLAIMTFYFALGFLWTYIWTRLYYQRDLEKQNKQLQQEIETKVRVIQTKDQEIQTVQKDKETIDFTVLAEKLIREGNLDEAMKWIGQALATNPNDARAILTKGRILKRQAMKPGVPEAQKTALLTQALDCVNRSIDLTPPDQRAEPIYNKACYEALLGFADKAVVATLQAAFQLKPELRKVAAGDNDLERLWQNADFIRLTGHNPPANH